MLSAKSQPSCPNLNVLTFQYILDPNLFITLYNNGGRPSALLITKLDMSPPKFLWRPMTWWRHQKETFSALLAICVRNSMVTGEFPAQRPVMWTFDVFNDLRLNKRMSKESWVWWFEMPSRPLWRQCNEWFCQTFFAPVMSFKTSDEISQNLAAVWVNKW